MTSASSIPVSSTLRVLSQNINGFQTKITIVCCVNGGFCVGSQPDCILHRLFIVS